MAALNPDALTLSLSPVSPAVSGFIGPTPLGLTLSPRSPRVWIGGPSENCWTMRYHNPSTGWELDGGNGLVLYRMSSTFNCNGPNTFDQLIIDQTLQAPSSITVWPFSTTPCNCPSLLGPEPAVLSLTLFEPAIHQSLLLAPLDLALIQSDPAVGSHLWPTPLTLTLSPAAPMIPGRLWPTPLELFLTPSDPAVVEHLWPTPLTLTLSPAAPLLTYHLRPTPLTLTLTPVWPAVVRHLWPMPLTLSFVPASPSVPAGVLGPHAIGLGLVPAAPGISGFVGPTPLTLTLSPSAPGIHGRLGPTPLTLTLTLAAPGISGAIGPTPLTLDLVLTAPGITGRLGPTPLTLDLVLTAPGITGRLGPTPLTLDLVPAEPSLGLHLNPSPLTLTLTPASVGVAAVLHLWPDATSLTLTPSAPTVSTGASPVSSPCCPSDLIPANLTAVITATVGAAALNGLTVPISYQTPIPRLGVNGWQGAVTACGGSTVAVELWCLGGSNWIVNLVVNGTGIMSTFADSSTCNPFVVNLSGVHGLSASSCNAFNDQIHMVIS